MGTLIGSQNLLSTATLTASADTANVDNLWDAFLTDFWQPGSGAQTVVIDNGSATSVDYWGVSGNLGTDSASIAIAWSDDDISYTTIETLNPTTDDVIFSTFTSVSHRYTKITVTGTDPKLAFISVGATHSLEGTLGPPFTPPEHAGEKVINVNLTETGAPISSIIKHTKRSVVMAMKDVTVSWLDANWETIYSEIDSSLFFLMWDSVNRPTKVAICWLTKDTKPSYQDPTFMQYTLRFNCLL